MEKGNVFLSEEEKKEKLILDFFYLNPKLILQMLEKKI